MGGGKFSPRPETESAEVSEQSQQSSTASGRPGASSTGSSSVAALQQTLTGTSNNPAVESRDANEDMDTFEAATFDRGYASEFASEIRSMSTSDLEDEFERQVESTESLSGTDLRAAKDEARFIGGVLASRADSSITASDIYRDNNISSRMPDGSIVNSTGSEELVDETLNEMTAVFQQCDEYVAGQIAQEIDVIGFETSIDSDGEFGSGVLRINTDSVSASDITASVDTPGTSKEYSFEEASESGPRYSVEHHISDSSHEKRLIAHEMAHAFHQHLGITHDGSRDILENNYPPGGLNLDPAHISDTPDIGFERREQLMTRLKSVGDNMQETRKYSMGATDSLPYRTNVPIRRYQLKNSSEVFAVGFATYQDDIVTATTKQREVVETFDEFITGDKWTDTSLNDLQTEGVSLFERGKKEAHVSTDARAGHEDGTYGQVALFEFTEEMFDGRTHAAGYVSDVTEEQVTFDYLGSQITVDRDKIDSVKERESLRGSS